jgi:hypothetical protein
MNASDADQYEEWVDDEAGPLVRPFTMTRGRTQPVNARFDLVTIVVATTPEAPPGAPLMPEHNGIIQLCQQPLSVAEVSAHLKLPLGAVRVLLDDLLQRGLIQALVTPPSADHIHDPQVLETLLDGLHSL